MATYDGAVVISYDDFADLLQKLGKYNHDKRDNDDDWREHYNEWKDNVDVRKLPYLLDVTIH